MQAYVDVAVVGRWPLQEFDSLALYSNILILIPRQDWNLEISFWSDVSFVQDSQIKILET